MPKITFIRHCESVFNAYGVKTYDINLTLNGREQAKTLNGVYDLVICSTLTRTRETLDHSNIRYKDVIFSELVREVRDGNIINIRADEIDEPEDEVDIKNRIGLFNELISNYGEKYDNIAVISHYIFILYTTGKSLGNCESLEINM